MTPDTEKLKALAEGATAGLWESWQSIPNAPYSITVGDFVLIDDLSKEDADYLAGAQPTTALALIAQNTQLQSELAALKAQVERMKQSISNRPEPPRYDDGLGGGPYINDRQRGDP